MKGRVAARALDAYVYPERGVYRPGETVHISALLRDGRGAAAAGLPLTLVVKRPDGVDYRRVIVEDQGLGGRSLSVPILSDARTGTWRVQAFVDPKSPAVGEATFLVEDYTPERLDLTLTPRDSMLVQGEETRIATATRYLYGAPGAGLEVSGEIIVQAAKTLTAPGLSRLHRRPRGRELRHGPQRDRGERDRRRAGPREPYGRRAGSGGRAAAGSEDRRARG